MLPNDHAMREEIVRVGQLMYAKDFVCSADGNISARLDEDRFLITPSGLHKGFLEPDQLLVVNGQGERTGLTTPAARRLRPTSELAMHLEVYRRRPDVVAVIHAHPPSTIALSIAGIAMDVCLLPEAVVTLGLIPTAPYATPSSLENVTAIRDLIVRHDAIVLQRHGTLTVGDSPMEAFMRLETVEQNARIGFMLAQLGIKKMLEPEQARKLLLQRQEMGLAFPDEAADFAAQCGVSPEIAVPNQFASQEIREMAEAIVQRYLAHR
jgi:L-fuculose-phosphate aldolase